MPTKTYVTCVYPPRWETSEDTIPYPHELLLTDERLTATRINPRGVVTFDWRLEDIVAVEEELPGDPMVLVIHACPPEKDDILRDPGCSSGSTSSSTAGGKRRYETARLDAHFVGQFFTPTTTPSGQKLDDITTLKSTLLRQTKPHSSIPPQSHLHVFINPTSGAGLAKQHWDSIVEPILSAAGVSGFSVTVTRSRGHAADEAGRIVQSVVYIVVLGGDGTVHEVLNGLLALQTPPKKIFLAVVPSGTGNAVASSIGCFSPADAALRIVKGSTKKLKLMRVQTGIPSPVNPGEIQWSPLQTLCIVVVSWGFHAQVVARSEWLRLLGNARFSWTAGYLIAFLTQFKGEVTLAGGEVQQFDHAKGELVRLQENSVRFDDAFTYFLCTKQSTLEPGFRVAPLADPADGFLDILFMRNATRNDLVAMATGANRQGIHLNEVEKVEYFKCRQMVLRIPKAGEVCLDGEIRKIEGGGGLKVEVLEGDRIEMFV